MSTPTTPAQDVLFSKLRKVLALTTSPVEGEAAAAAEMLQKFLTQHNLSIADLESKGQSAPGIREQGYDLGKAAFTWKLNLADYIAEYYYCHPIVNRVTKTVAFIGRPDNVEALRMLYGWLIDQVRRIATEERRLHIDSTGEHIDPLRWQIAFGQGAVSRLRDRLDDLKQQQSDAAGSALVVHHQSEISDYTEKKYGYRTDGKETEEDRAYRLQRERHNQEMADLKERDPEAYYAARPWERPLTPEQQAEADREYETRHKRDRIREERNRRRREQRESEGRTRRSARTDWDKEDQTYAARQAGKSAADRINLTPFLTGDTTSTSTDSPRKLKKGGR